MPDRPIFSPLPPAGGRGAGGEGGTALNPPSHPPHSPPPVARRKAGGRGEKGGPRLKGQGTCCPSKPGERGEGIQITANRYYCLTQRLPEIASKWPRKPTRSPLLPPSASSWAASP